MPFWGAMGVGASQILKATAGGAIRRAATGGIVGGAIGAGTSDRNTSTGVLSDALWGAGMGLGVGGLLNATAVKTAWGAAQGLAPRLPGIAKQTAYGGMGAATFALGNPKTVAGLGLAGLGMYGLANSGAQESEGTNEDVAATVQMNNLSSTGFNPGMGASARQTGNQMWINSTMGLTQGLHAGRHR